MKQPQEFTDWCRKHHIHPRSHDCSVAWAAWQACYKWLIAKFEEANNDRKK